MEHTYVSRPTQPNPLRFSGWNIGVAMVTSSERIKNLETWNSSIDVFLVVRLFAWPDFLSNEQLCTA